MEIFGQYKIPKQFGSLDSKKMDGFKNKIKLMIRQVTTE